MRDVEALGHEPMGKLLLRLSTPSVVGMMVQSLYNVVDAFFVGRSVGPHGIAAVFSAFPIQIVVMAFALLMGSGGVSLISRSLGARDVDRAERALGTITSVSLILGAIMAGVIVLLAEPLVRVLGASESGIFLKILLPAAAPSIVNGLRIGLGVAWMCLVSAEMLPGSLSGVGYLITHAYTVGRTDVVIAGMACISAVGALLDLAFQWFEKRHYSWKQLSR